LKRIQIVLIALFLIPVYLLAIFKIVLPSQQLSEEEKRTLRQQPVFTVDSLLKGQYTQEYEEFFSDQFPFRSFFINTHQQLLEWMQAPLTDVFLYTGPGEDLGEGERLEPDLADKISQPPVPTLTPTPKPTAVPTWETTTPSSAAPTEATTETTLPAETTKPAAEVPSVDGEVTKYSAVVVVNQTAMELYYFSETRNRRYASLVSLLGEKVPDVRVFNMIAPTSVEFNSPAKYHSMSSSQKNSIQFIYDHLSDAVIPVDAYSEILQHCKEYLYFRTDHHWTARGAYCAYRAFIQKAGFEPIPLDGFTGGQLEATFLGSLYTYTKSSILRNNPDTVEYFLPNVTIDGKAFTSVAMTEGYRVKAVYTKIGSSNKYLIFTGGDNPLIQFKTNLANGKKLLVIKDSFGNALVPFLTNHYEEVYVMDPRSLTANLPDFIRNHGIQDVLVTNYSFGASNTGWNNKFEAMIG
jgi:hypothetical protein